MYGGALQVGEMGMAETCKERAQRLGPRALDVRMVPDGLPGLGDPDLGKGAAVAPQRLDRVGVAVGPERRIERPVAAEHRGGGRERLGPRGEAFVELGDGVAALAPCPLAESLAQGHLL